MLCVFDMSGIIMLKQDYFIKKNTGALNDRQGENKQGVWKKPKKRREKTKKQKKRKKKETKSQKER